MVLDFLLFFSKGKVALFYNFWWDIIQLKWISWCIIYFQSALEHLIYFAKNDEFVPINFIFNYRTVLPFYSGSLPKCNAVNIVPSFQTG